MKSVAYIFFVSLLLAGVVFAQTGPSGIVAPSGAHPTGGVWSVGDKYQLVFLTRGKTNLGSGREHIDYFNRHVNDVAEGSVLPGVSDATWYVLGSTVSVDARDNAVVEHPVYMLNGTSLMASNNADFWDTTMPEAIDLDEDGTEVVEGSWPNRYVWTGTTGGGVGKSGDQLDGEDGASKAFRFGVISGWLTNGNGDNTPDTQNWRFWVVSQPLMITNGAPDTTPPSPTNMTWAAVPAGLSSEAVHMYATTAYDLESTPVTYMFSNTVTHITSGWQTSAYWSNNVPERSLNAYRVKARDAVGNETQWSEERSSSPSVYGLDYLPAPTGEHPVTGEPWQIGDFYHLLFVTSVETNVVGDHDIAYWNAYVNAVAAGSSISGMGSVTWFVLGSTTLVDAKDNCVISAPVYIMDGRLFSTNSADFWDATIPVAVDYDESGIKQSDGSYGRVWTGTVRPGVGSSGNQLDNASTTTKTSRWNAGGGGADWLNNDGTLADTTLRRFFAVSEPIEIIYPPPPAGTVLILK